MQPVKNYSFTTNGTLTAAFNVRAWDLGWGSVAKFSLDTDVSNCKYYYAASA